MERYTQSNGIVIETVTFTSAEGLEPLTEREYKALECYEIRRRNNEPTPSIKDLMAHTGINSSSYVRNFLINKLVEKGYLNAWPKASDGRNLSRGTTIKVAFETIDPKA